MSDLKDSAIKLFGKTIPLPINLQLVDVYSANESCSGEVPSHNNSPAFHKNKSERERKEQEGNMECSGKEIANDQHVDNSNQTNEESIDVTTSSGIIGENHKTPSTEGEISSQKDFKNGEQSESSVSQEKTLKKPDKILPCPRCNSMDTKFCYYNNYNVNQPRHFCKNCQRYWTAGGTMRNVPVGAGRRKNKSSSASHYRQIMISEALRTVQANAANGIQSPTLVNNGTVLTFGTDSPLCESVASVLNLSEKARNGVRNGYDRPEPRNHMSHGGSTYNGDDSSSGPTVTGNLNSSEKGSNGGAQESVKTIQGIPTPPPPQIPCFPGHPWSYPWTSAMPPPTFSPSGFPVSFYPVTNFWGCTVPNLWNVPPCPPLSSSSLTPFAPISSPTSPLGKHSRDGNILNHDEPSRDRITSERGVLVPKTLRIDDPSEAAKSSIWTTLGIKSEKSNSFNGGGLFKGFQSKSQDKNYVAETSPLLQANPAALSRSLNFHERT